MPVAKLSQIELGRSANPEFKTVARIAGVLWVSVSMAIAVAVGLLEASKGYSESGPGLLQPAMKTARDVERIRGRSIQTQRAIEHVAMALDSAIDGATRRQPKNKSRQRK